MIELTGLQKIEGARTALDIASLRVEDGEIIAVVGPAASGVDILFEMLLGRTRPSGGSLRLGGVSPLDKASYSLAVGFLFAEDALYVHRSPLGNLTLHCQLYGLPRARAEEVLAQIGMADQAHVSVSTLPSGLARRVAFGRAILHKPKALVLNDPFRRCDETTIAVLSSLMRGAADDGAALLVLAPDASHLVPLCDTIHSLVGGRLVEEQRPADRPAAQPFKIPVRGEDKVILVNPASILYVEAEAGRCCLHTGEGVLPTQYSLVDLEQRLLRSGFFRAHRAFLVNLQHVREVIPYTRNSFSLRLDDEAGTEIPLSKSAAAELRQLLGY